MCYVTIRESGLTKTYNLVKKLPSSLKSLRLHNCRDGGPLLSLIPEQFPNLASLDLFNCMQSEVEPWETLFAGCQ